MDTNVFLYVANEAVSEAIHEIVELGGRVTHQFGKSAIVARLPENCNVLTMCDHSRRQIGWDPSLFPNP